MADISHLLAVLWAKKVSGGVLFLQRYAVPRPLTSVVNPFEVFHGYGSCSGR